MRPRAKLHKQKVSEKVSMKRFVSLSACALALAALWWALTGGEPSSWLIGAPSIIVALVSIRLLSGPREQPSISPLGLIRFVPFFLLRCFTAGLDVALRALSARMSLNPGWIEYRARLPAGAPRVAFINVICLLPGTLSADLVEDRVTLHLLDSQQDHTRELERVERAVAGIFGVPCDG